MAGESLGLSAAWMPPWAIIVLASPKRSLVARMTRAPLSGASSAAAAPGSAPTDDEHVGFGVHTGQIERVRIDAAAPLQGSGKLVQRLAPLLGPMRSSRKPAAT